MDIGVESTTLVDEFLVWIRLGLVGGMFWNGIGGELRHGG